MKAYCIFALGASSKVLAFSTTRSAIRRQESRRFEMEKSSLSRPAENIIAKPTDPDTNKIPISQSKVPVMDALAMLAAGDSTKEYKRGLLTIVCITFLFSSNSPAIHAAFSGSDPPPVLLLNAAVSCVALVGLLLGGESLESNTPLPSTLDRSKENEESLAFQGGIELGLWKMLGTTANLYGLALTTASHGALLIQLTTLIVPVSTGFC